MSLLIVWGRDRFSGMTAAMRLAFVTTWVDDVTDFLKL